MKHKVFRIIIILGVIAFELGFFSSLSEEAMASTDNTFVGYATVDPGKKDMARKSGNSKIPVFVCLQPPIKCYIYSVSGLGNHNIFKAPANDIIDSVYRVMDTHSILSNKSGNGLFFILPAPPVFKSKKPPQE